MISGRSSSSAIPSSPCDASWGWTPAVANTTSGNALAAAKVLIETDLKAEDIARKSIKVASDICVFTNNNVTVEKV